MEAAANSNLSEFLDRCRVREEGRKRERADAAAVRNRSVSVFHAELTLSLACCRIRHSRTRRKESCYRVRILSLSYTFFPLASFLVPTGRRVSLSFELTSLFLCGFPLSFDDAELDQAVKWTCLYGMFLNQVRPLLFQSALLRRVQSSTDSSSSPNFVARDFSPKSAPQPPESTFKTVSTTLSSRLSRRPPSPASSSDRPPTTLLSTARS